MSVSDETEVLWFGDAAASGPVLVFLHEGLGSAKQWRDFPERIARATKLRAMAYSRLGYGASASIALPRPLDYMQREATGALPRLLDALGITSAILVGHSDGASIALVAAATDPRVKALALEAPHVFVEDVSVASIAHAREAYEIGDLRDKLAKHHGANVDVAFRGWNDAWLDPAFRAWNIEEFLPRVAVPVLVVQGEDDPYGTRAQVDAIANQANGPVDVLMLRACGHAPHRDRPAETESAIVGFVARAIGATIA